MEWYHALGAGLITVVSPLMEKPYKLGGTTTGHQREKEEMEKLSTDCDSLNGKWWDSWIAIPYHILDALEVDLKEPVEVVIFKEYKGESSFTITCKVRMILGKPSFLLRFHLYCPFKYKNKN